MNNIEKELLCTIDDLFSNRVKDEHGKIKKYDNTDKEKYLNLFNDIKNAFIFNRENIDSKHYDFYMLVIDRIIELLKNKI